MQLQFISLTAPTPLTRLRQKRGRSCFALLITILAAVSTPLPRNFPAPLRAPQAFAQTPARQAEADRLLAQGTKQAQTNQFQAAIQSWEQALVIYRDIKNRQSEGKALGNLGIAYYSLGDLTRAIEYQQQWLAIAREIKDRQSEGKALGNLGIAYKHLGDLPHAIDYHKQALEIAREIKDRQSEGKALGNLGIAYYFLGDLTRAIDYHRKALALAKRNHDRQSENKALGSLGLVYYSQGDLTRAIEYEQQLLTNAREIKDRQSEGKALGNLGLAYTSLGDLTSAIEYEQQSLAIAREIKDRQSEGRALGNLGNAYASLGDYAKALDYQQQWLAIAREIKDRQSEGKALGNLGNAYYFLGDLPRAIEYQKQWLAIAREIKDRQSEGAALGNLGLAYQAQGDLTGAIDYEKQLLAIARELKDRQSEGKALGNLGLAYYFLGDLTRAIEYEKQLLAIAREIKDRQSEGIALNNLGYALQKAGKLAAAQRTLIKGIHVWESLRAGLGRNDANKVSIFETQATTYSTLQQVLIAQNKTNAALEIAERGRARAFVELLARRLDRRQTENTITPPKLSQIKKIASTQNSTLVQYSIIYDYFKVQNQEKWRESELYVWVIKPTGEVTFRRRDLKPLWQQQNTTLENLVRSIRGSSPLEWSKPLKQLHQLLIQPIAEDLPKDPTARVIFIPQQSLFLVPFPALQEQDGKYLIEQHTILTAPSIQVLALTHQRRQQVQAGQKNALVVGIPRNVVVVGNPTMPKVAPEPGVPPQQLSSLPGATDEAEAIAQILHTQAFTGNEATKVAIVHQLPKAQIIHLATHGKADDVRGLGSWIALAPSITDNGLLTAEEILALKLRAQLVVLSACETGRGRITGDGVIGLSRSLISAGVPSVIVSLWSAPDAPTAALMTGFYQNLKSYPDKAQALRMAMLKTMQQNPNPIDWAAFTLIGEAE